jgi:AcrR family transcriptional regulator
MPRSAEPARRRILDAALRLFAERGIEAISLREIRLAAGQRNAGALQYHFGSKDGLLKALLERELPPLVARRRALLAVAEQSGELRQAAAVFVLPFAEFATGNPEQQAVVMLLNQLHDDVNLSFSQIMNLVGDTAIGEAADLLMRRLDHIEPALLSERITVAHSIFLHAAATRARGGSRERHLDDATFQANLVDMFLGALIAPVTRPDSGVIAS